jgi:FKBP-type peptidyl-prolyl cis-trans isomerase FkpA
MLWVKPYMTLKHALLLIPAFTLISCSSAPPTADANAAYLEKAAAERGAVRTSSGLIYQEVRGGTGTSPTATDTVKVNYSGTLVNGKKFDSGDGTKFPVNRVIPCWTEGLQKMKVGGKAVLVCPASIAYGDQGSFPEIPGGATLIFEIELLGIGQ